MDASVVKAVGVVVFSSEPVVELGLRQVLARTAEFDVLAACGTYASLTQAIVSLRPELILFCLDSASDLAGIGGIRRLVPECGLVLFGREMSPEFAHAALDLGVRAVVSTTSSADTLIECLQAAANKEMWLDRALSMDMLRNRTVPLTKRQGQLVSLLVQGMKNKEIATTLGLSEATVKAYLTKLFEKLGVKDRFELAVYGLKNLKYVQDSGAEPGAPPKIPLRSIVARRGGLRAVAGVGRVS